MGFDIAYYGIDHRNAGILAGIYDGSIWKQSELHQNVEDYYDLSICAVIISIIGARAYYVIFSLGYVQRRPV
ncbi:MAG: prolipoprotein diacylglyceryl transferase family protein [Dorea sp.]